MEAIFRIQLIALSGGSISSYSSSTDIGDKTLPGQTEYILIFEGKISPLIFVYEFSKAFDRRYKGASPWAYSKLGSKLAIISLIHCCHSYGKEREKKPKITSLRV